MLWRAGAVLQLLDGHQQAGLAVDDDVGDAAGGRADHRQAHGHGLQVDDAQGLVDRRAHEDVGGSQDGLELAAREHLLDLNAKLFLGFYVPSRKLPVHFYFIKQHILLSKAEMYF